MTTIEKPLHRLQAVDLMSRDLVIIPEDMTLPEAARRLVRNQVSGAPVVDCRGVLVGVISASDFLRQVTVNAPRITDAGWPCVYSEWQFVNADDLPEESVHGRMTHDPVAVGEHTPITELARLMVDAHIHRIVIVDEKQVPLGIVTSTDILGAVSRHAGEDDAFAPSAPPHSTVAD